ncbi:MAG: prolipoprotein diacylglyceryl transferase [Chloroflexi bacterium]|nr:prolipoprotein diacylglyceryl transferase [Chloroflexota bacterium]
MGGASIAFRIGPISVAWYGIIIVAATLAAGYVAQSEAERRGDDPEHVWNAFLLCLLFGIVGARLYHVISSLDYYIQYPLQVFNTRAGGLGIIGAVLGGILGLWIYTRRAKLSFLHWADIAVPGLLLAQAIGRWGNFINQELYGYPTDLPWGIYIDPMHRLPEFADYERFHPTFLYESLWNLIGFGLFMVLARKLRNWLRDGDLLLLYGIYYPIGRFLVEFQRPDAWKIGTLATAQWISLAAAAICAILLFLRHRRAPAAPNQVPGSSS